MKHLKKVCSKKRTKKMKSLERRILMNVLTRRNCEIYNVNEKSKNRPKMLYNCNVNNKIVEFDIDTGSPVSCEPTLAIGYCWWNNIDKNIEKLVENCSACQITRSDPRKIPTQLWKQASRPL